MSLNEHFARAIGFSRAVVFPRWPIFKIVSFFGELSCERQPDVISKPKMMSHVTDVKTKVLPSVLKLQKREKICGLNEH